MKTPRKAGAGGSLALCFFLFISSSAAAGNMRLYTETQPHMGTEFTLRAYASEERNEAVATAFKKAFARVETLNQICSDYLPESEINQFAKAPVGERIALSADLSVLPSSNAWLALAFCPSSQEGSCLFWATK